MELLSTYATAILAIQALVCGFAGAVLADRKGYAHGFGFAWGFFFAYAGVLVVACVATKTDVLETRAIDDRQSKRCKRCAELVRYRANVCHWCGHEFEAARAR